PAGDPARPGFCRSCQPIIFSKRSSNGCSSPLLVTQYWQYAPDSIGLLTRPAFRGMPGRPRPGRGWLRAASCAGAASSCHEPDGGGDPSGFSCPLGAFFGAPVLYPFAFQSLSGQNVAVL